jgi:pimeloyl-ACP methyl ester carboxylesterase
LGDIGDPSGTFEVQAVNLAGMIVSSSSIQENPLNPRDISSESGEIKLTLMRDNQRRRDTPFRTVHSLASRLLDTWVSSVHTADITIIANAEGAKVTHDRAPAPERADEIPANVAKRKSAIAVAVAAVIGMAIGTHAASAAPVESTSDTTTYHRAQVMGVGIFYREAGPKDAPVIVLLHGYPASSRQYASLIPLLATHYHVIAPDYPGFGQSEAPSPSKYTYTFDHLAQTMSGLLDQLNVKHYALYLQDYGGPVGFRMMEAHPERVQALVIQNANAYKEGLGKNWLTIERYWADPSAHPEVIDYFTSLELTRQRHVINSPNPERYDPEVWLQEYAFLSQPGERGIQAALLYDYRRNVALYPQWQEWLRKYKPPTLVLWGRYDPSFTTPGALAYKRDLPDAEVDILDAGHFATEEKVDEIASRMLDFLGRVEK